MTVDYYEGYQGDEEDQPGFDDGGYYEKVGNEEYQDTSLHHADCECVLCMDKDIDLIDNFEIVGKNK